MGKKSETVSPKEASGILRDERKWRAEDAHRDIMRAEAHKRDPKLMKDVAKVNEDKLAEMKKVSAVCTGGAK